MMTTEEIFGGGEALLQPVLVGSLEGRFFVPDYQRGYRWGEHEVSQLLRDISEHIQAKGREYYLQPLVVKPMDDGGWELVDGQQRLTTLYLILRRIRDYLPQSEVRYSLEYETRPGSAEYLDDPTEGPAADNIDYFHMFHASKVIGQWFDAQENPSLAAINLYKALTSTVFVIWYEAPQEAGFDSRELFTRLNVGRIPLTDSELVKAWLLSHAERPLETAAQWDGFERDLRSPEVWAFVTGTASETATHIELLLDTIADLMNGEQPLSRAPFSTFQTLREAFPHSLDKLWNRVVDLHSLIIGWYEDRVVFHKVGFLIAVRQATFFDLVKLAEGVPRSAFEAQLNELIRQSLKLPWHGVESLSYGKGGGKASRVLLLMNVETVSRSAHSSERYSFDAHARRLWSLEHIHAQRSEGLNRVEQWTSWLKDHSSALDVLDISDEQRDNVRQRITDAIGTITSGSFETLRQEIVAMFSNDDAASTGGPETGDRTEIDTISNLALLSSTDNSVLNNSVFEVKRRHLIALDQAGSFIPVCTRNVFLKYYVTGDSAQQLHFWGPNDRIAYLAAMKTALSPYLLEDLPENDELDDVESNDEDTEVFV